MDAASQRAQRISFVRLVQLHPINGAAPKRLWLHNLSVGGAFIRASEPLPIGTRARIRLVSPDQQIVELGEARVCWQRTVASPLEPTGFGVEFTQLGEAGKSFLQACVDLGTTAQKTAPAEPEAEVEAPLRAPGYRPRTVTKPDANRGPDANNSWIRFSGLVPST